MVVFSIVQPGTWLEGIDDREMEFKLSGIIRNLISVFYEANLNLNLFESERSRKFLEMNELREFDSESNRLKWQKQQQRDELARLELEREYSRQGKQFDPYSDEGRVDLQIYVNKMAWQDGEIPTEFSDKMIFLYAKSFLFSLDSFDRFLGVLAREDGAPEGILSIHKKIKTAFPSLRGVRNTAHHLEDRSRGLGEYSKVQKKKLKLLLKPIVNDVIHAPSGGVLILNQLNGSRYGCTMADGHFGEVDVSVESLGKMHEMLNDVLNSFSWKGSPSVHPR